MTEYYGQQKVSDTGSFENIVSFFIRQALGRTRTTVPVIVLAVHGGGVGAPPTVDVQVLVNQMDGVGNKTAHGKILGIPVFRQQGGNNAIIIDPVAKDIGLLVVSDRDISVVKSTNKQANPGSYRRFNLADGTYVGGIINPANPTQYLQFMDSGLKVLDKNGNKIELTSNGIKVTDANSNVITMKSGEIDITTTTLKITAGDVTISGNLDVTGHVGAGGTVTAGVGGADSVGLQTHVHPPFPNPPTPGT